MKRKLISFLKHLNNYIGLLKKSNLRKKAVIQNINKLLSGQICFDIGASYYAHPNWNLFLDNKTTNWISLDPIEKNLYYLKELNVKSNISKEITALSKEGGTKTLYITNVDSGSSLLKPEVHENNKHRVELDYFFPVIEKTIETKTINSIFENHFKKNHPILLKLDIQGIEFDIIKSLDEEYLENVICIETEQAILSKPLMKNSSQLNTVYEFFAERDYELAYVKVMNCKKTNINNKIKTSYIVGETDLLFLLNPDQVINKGISYCFAMLGVYASYNLYEEVYSFSKKLLKLKISSTERNYLNDIIKSLT